jgi:type I restriction enzyme R subunit
MIVISDGFDARYGSLSASWDRFMIWKTKDGKSEAGKTKPQLYTMIEGMFAREVLLDLIAHYTVFEQDKKTDPETGIATITLIKKIAAYHQYYAVKKALVSTKTAAGGGSRKAGVVWHTQGSGKSLSMVFYAGELIRNLDNPTIVMITDRNDLDEQLFGTFYGVRKFLRQAPQQAESTADLKELLQTSGGGVIFTTIQKFSPEEAQEEFPLLTDRENVIVIADEAHRSQYGFEAKTTYRDFSSKKIGRLRRMVLRSICVMLSLRRRLLDLRVRLLRRLTRLLRRFLEIILIFMIFSRR